MGSDRRGNTVSTLGRVAVVPSSPERSGTIDIFSFPLEQMTETALNIIKITPLLPESFTIRLVVNGISGPEKRYPEEINDVLWSNGGVNISIELQEGIFSAFSLYNSAQITYESLVCYIDGVKMNLGFKQ